MPSTAHQHSLVIVPAYNESQSISNVVAELRDQLPHCDVLVIDDGSTDGTARKVPPGASLLCLPFNLGIGGAMQAGYRYAAYHGYDVAIQVDGDGQHPPHQVQTLIDALSSQNADVVIGSRFLQGGQYHQQPARMFGIRVIRLLTRLLIGTNITDPTSGFRAVNKKTIHAFAHWYPEDYPEPQVVPLLHRAGFQIREVPTTMRQRTTGHTSIPLMRGVFYVIKVSVALLLDTVRHPWPKEKVELP